MTGTMSKLREKRLSPRRPIVADQAQQPAFKVKDTPTATGLAWIAAVLLGAVILTSSLTWSRFVLPNGSPVPIQRVVAALFILFLVVYGLIVRPRAFSGMLLYVSVSAAWLAWVGVEVVIHAAHNDFQLSPALLDLSKYSLNLILAGAVAYAVRAHVLALRRLGTLLVWSAIVAVSISLLCLTLYLFGVRIIDGYAIRTFGDAWGVWPSSGVVPRVVGPTAEPQQLSVVFVTGLLVAVQRRALRYQLLGLAGLAVLLFSQSKFALISLVVIIVFWGFLILRRIALRRTGKIFATVGGLAIFGVLGAYAATLPTFQESLKSGFNAGAFTERADNANILIHAFTSSPILGIGPGQYGAFRSRVLGEPVDNTYYPNNDYLKVLSETGVIGLGLMALLLAVLTYYTIRALKKRGAQSTRDVAHRREIATACAIGAVLIAMNMAIGYELLHVFFWINCGLLVALGSHGTRNPKVLRAATATGLQ